MVVVFQFHTCTHPNLTSLLEQQSVSPFQLMIANEAMYTIDVNTRVDIIFGKSSKQKYLCILIVITCGQPYAHSRLQVQTCIHSYYNISE